MQQNTKSKIEEIGLFLIRSAYYVSYFVHLKARSVQITVNGLLHTRNEV